MPAQYFVEVDDFACFARYVCSFRENPLRVYSHNLNGKMVLSSRRILSKSLLSFYTSTTKSGRYVSYSAKGGKEESGIVNSTKAFSTYAPIVHLNSLPSTFNTHPKKIEDKFKPIQVEDLGSLARLTYDPEAPDEPDLTLFLFPHKQKWIIGYITKIDLEDVVYFFNYVVMKEEPSKPFLRYSLQEAKEPIFTDRFQHGYSYLPIIKLKKEHQIFGLH
ncbi:MAG: hypothetical protein ACE5EJ_06340 [Nitrosopumilaceae archaeon]